jgi:hypothetical protein
MELTKHIQLSIVSVGLLTALKVTAQAGVGPAPFCMPTYNAGSIPCNQPNASNNATNFINDFIDSFNTTGATVNITDNNNGCQTQLLGGVQQNYFYKGCPTYLRVTPGQVVTCNFRSGIIFDQGFAVFIDWNQNNIFDLPGERVAAVPGLPLAATWCSAAFTVPAAQPNGTYRMRVRCAYVTSGGLIDPCLLYSFGETQDYNVIIGGTCAVLPIELLSYNGEYNNNQVYLNWVTSTEINSEYFSIERSYDNENFEYLAKINASGGSNSLLSYSAIDKYAKNNKIVYYRLKQFDKGSSEERFSKTITVYTNNQNSGFDVFPNPANSQITIIIPNSLSGTVVTTEIFDNTGTKVAGTSNHLDIQNDQLVFNIEHLPNGVYYVRVTDEAGEVSKKILIKQ